MQIMDVCAAMEICEERFDLFIGPLLHMRALHNKLITNFLNAWVFQRIKRIAYLLIVLLIDLLKQTNPASGPFTAALNPAEHVFFTLKKKRDRTIIHVKPINAVEI